ncbi:ArdC family protein [Tahibacter caeni]|uniref:ArdC family protein n=1 Tax=Tahibacter caeni TaxID=1453545 RepID=UPI002148E50B|nr:zincin-like metallopeptidase domain-containing protein [Tahibacter caeni]
MHASAATSTTRVDVYTRVTEKIIADLENVRRPWHKPWTDNVAGTPATMPLRHNGVAYRGVNVLLLWGAAIERGYRAPIWMTFKQAQELGAHVKKGETGTPIVYANRITATETGENGEDEERHIAFMKGYTVFNVEQIEGLPAQYQPPAAASAIPLPETLVAAERFFATTGATFRHGGNRACYSRAADVIQLPPLAAFHDAESYAATKAHELVHWTGHGTRLAREFGKRFGDNAYAFEELIAELGAAFLCAMLGVTPEIQPDHADYLAYWLSILKADKRAIFTAAAQAQAAADFLHSLQSSQ